ncbi:hypothetical protein BGZ72_001153 [Mortierella alpina]|nr:hypothetical protein BGZ72_001153 [Mortierella alpina]
MTLTKHFPSTAVIPLSEANLNKHTIQSPASRDAKLKHILMYLDHQRALIAFDRAVDDLAAATSKSGHTRSNATALQNRQPPMRKSSLQTLQQQAEAQHEHRPRYHRSQTWLSPLQRLDQSPRDDGHHEMHVSDALDPSLALPRALPRSALFSGESFPSRRDSFQSTSGLQEPSPPEDRTVDSYKNNRVRRATLEQAPLAPKQEEQYRPRIDESRLVQYRKVYDDGFQECFARKQSQKKLPEALVSTDKVKKTARLGRFSFLKGRQSLPAPPKTTQEGAAGHDSQSRSQSMTTLVRKGFEAGDDSRQAGSIQPGETFTRRPSKAKQLFLDVFKLSSKPHVLVESPKTGSPLKQHTEFNEEPTAEESECHELPTRRSVLHLEHLQITHDLPQPEERDLGCAGEPDQDSNSIDNASYVKQTSLAPPPASFVLRHSSSYNDIYSNKHRSLANTKTLGHYSALGPGSVLSKSPNEIRNLTVALGDPGRRRGSHSSQRRFVAIAPEQQADLEGVGHRQNTFGIPVAVV